MLTRRERGAFTLVELLTVIAIIGILAGLLLPAITWAVKEARIKQAYAEISNIKTALEQYQAVWGYYPPDSMEGDANGDGVINAADMVLDNATHPSTPGECLYFYLCVNFTVASEYGRANNTAGLAEFAPLTNPVKEAYATRTHDALMSPQSGHMRDLRGAGFPALVDPWGLPYMYNAPGGLYGEPRHNRKSPDLFSLGQNGKTCQTAIELSNGYPPQPNPQLLDTQIYYRYANHDIMQPRLVPSQWQAGLTDLGADVVFSANNAGPPVIWLSGNDVDAGKGGNPQSENYESGAADDINNW